MSDIRLSKGILKELGYSPAFGVPYARRDFRNGQEFAVCPRCDMPIVLFERKDFESMSGMEYAVHYNERHAKDDGRVQVDGVWYEKDE